MNASTGPAIVQADMTVLLEVDHEMYAEARDALAAFSELVKSPEHIHTYRITPLSLWNAAASGHTPEEVVESLQRFSRYEVPEYTHKVTITGYTYKVKITEYTDKEKIIEYTDKVKITEYTTK